MTNSYDFCHDVAVDSEGRVVMVGQATNIVSNYDSAVVRLTSGGSLDTSWGYEDSGIVVHSYVSVPRSPVAVGSGLLGDIRPAAVVRQIRHGERVADLADELKRLTFRSRSVTGRVKPAT